MISDQVLKNTVKGIKNVTGFDLCVADGSGTIIAGTFTPDINFLDRIVAFMDSEDDFIKEDEICFIKDKYLEHKIFALAVKNGEGTLSADMATVAKMAAFQVRQLFEAYDSQTAVNDFLTNLLVNVALPANAENEAKGIGIDPSEKRTVIVAQCFPDKYEKAYETVKKKMEGENTYVVSPDNKIIVIIAEVGKTTELQKRMAKMIKAVNADEKLICRMGYGVFAENIIGLRESYEQAKTAIDVGKIFYPDREFMSYSELGFGRIIYNLPKEVCDMFLEEYFDKKIIEEIDSEIINTVNVFFENSFNISETSRKLFIHRNTLIYRLNKIQKITGLDVKTLDGAIIFKVAVMIQKKYEAELDK